MNVKHAVTVAFKKILINKQIEINKHTNAVILMY